MSYEGWRIALAKPRSVLEPTMIVYGYLVFDNNGEIYDRINAVYDGEGEVAIYSKEYGYISLDDDDYSVFVQNELTTLRVVDDMLKSNNLPLDESGVITPRFAMRASE